MSFLNKINVFLWFNMIKQVFNRKSNKALVSYIIKINTLHQDVLLVLGLGDRSARYHRKKITAPKFRILEEAWPFGTKSCVSLGRHSTVCK